MLCLLAVSLLGFELTATEQVAVGAAGETRSVFTTRTALLTARDAWCADPTSAAVTFGAIGTWDVSAITDMSYLFCAQLGSQWTSLGCNPACSTFNDGINSWDTASVTTMRAMFARARAFNQPLSFNTSSVTNMYRMFDYADALSDCNKLAIHTSLSSSSAWAADMWAAAGYSGWAGFCQPPPLCPAGVAGPQ